MNCSDFHQVATFFSFSKMRFTADADEASCTQMKGGPNKNPSSAKQQKQSCKQLLPKLHVDGPRAAPAIDVGCNILRPCGLHRG